MSTPTFSTEANLSVAGRRRLKNGRFDDENKFLNEPTPLLTGSSRSLGAFSGILDESQVERMASSAKSSANFWVSRKWNNTGVAPEVSDMAQQAALLFLESAAKSGKAPANPSAYMMTIARRAVSDSNVTGRRRNWEIYSANAKLQKWKEEFRTENHRDAKRSEIDAEKTIIIESVDKDHRPPWNFDDANSRLAPISLDAEQVNNLATASFPGSDYEDQSFDPSSPMGEALTAVIEKDLAAAGFPLSTSNGTDGGVRQKMATAGMNYWEAIREVNPELPELQPKSINPRRAAVIRSTIESAGGFTKVLEQWSEVGDSDVTDALFAPWGNLSFEHKEAVFDFFNAPRITKYNNGPENLWIKAIGRATNRTRPGDTAKTGTTQGE
jgi:hypothetical protein